MVIRSFSLGDERIGERVNYDHLSVKACIFENDTSGIEERLASGLGIRNNG